MLSVLSHRMGSILTPLSSYVAQRREAGIMPNHLSRHSLGCTVSMSVSINPGEMQFTLQKSTHSTERHRASCTNPALDALYCLYVSLDLITSRGDPHSCLFLWHVH
jgi:hypothetical protein